MEEVFPGAAFSKEEAELLRRGDTPDLWAGSPPGRRATAPGSPTRGDGAQPLPQFPQLGSSGWEKIFPEV